MGYHEGVAWAYRRLACRTKEVQQYTLLIDFKYLERAIKRLSGSLNACDFSTCGSKGRGPNKPKRPTGCCGGCYDSCGYYSSLDTLSDREYEFLISIFREGYGFWMDGVGCRIPRSFRSWTCVLYHCRGWGNSKTELYQKIAEMFKYQYSKALDWRRKPGTCLKSVRRGLSKLMEKLPKDIPTLQKKELTDALEYIEKTAFYKKVANIEHEEPIPLGM